MEHLSTTSCSLKPHANLMEAAILIKVPAFMSTQRGVILIGPLGPASQPGMKVQAETTQPLIIMVRKAFLCGVFVDIC